MTKKIKRHEYNSKKEFQDDLDLMFSNCRKYNTDPGSIYVTHANTLDNFAKKLLKKVRNIDCTDRRNNLPTQSPTTKEVIKSPKKSSRSNSKSKKSKKSSSKSRSSSKKRSSGNLTATLSVDGVELIPSEEQQSKKSNDNVITSPSTRRRNSRAKGRGRPKKGKDSKRSTSPSSNELIDLQSETSTSDGDSMVIDVDQDDTLSEEKETDPDDSDDHSAIAETIHEFLAEDPQIRSWRLWALESRITRVVSKNNHLMLNIFLINFI